MQERASQRDLSDTQLDRTPVVWTPKRHVSSANAGTSGSDQPCVGRTMEPEPCSLADLKRQLLKGLDTESADIYMASWRKSTVKQYSSYLIKWTVYCVENSVNLRSAKLVQVISPKLLGMLILCLRPGTHWTRCLPESWLSRH